MPVLRGEFASLNIQRDLLAFTEDDKIHLVSSSELSNRLKVIVQRPYLYSPYFLDDVPALQSSLFPRT